MRDMRSTPRFHIRLFLPYAVLVLAVFVLTGAFGEAQTTNDNWLNRGTGDWFDGGNWSEESPPQSPFDTATVTNGGTAEILGPPVGPSPPPPPSAVSLTIGQIGGRAGSKVIVDGNRSTLSVDNQISVQNGELDVSGGGTVSLGSLAIGSGGLVSIGTSAAGTSAAAGTLIFTTPAAQIQIGVGGNLDFNLTDTTTLSANITGAGTITKRGSGTATLSGNNGYTGGTNIQAGTLIGASSTAFGNGPINISAGAAASVQASMQIGANISGQGQVLLIGPSTLTLAGNNSYSGGTTVAGGTLVAASNNAFGTGTVTGDGSGSESKVIIGSGLTVPNSFVMNNGASLDNSGTINSVSSHVGAASIVNRSGGTIGGVLLSSGAANAVQLFSGSAIQGDLNLGNNSGTQLIFDGGGNQLLSQAVTGNITNAGSLTKQGTGTWTVDKALAAPVSVDVVAGKLEVNSTLSSSRVTVQSGATIGGSGFITGNLTALGTISPGNSPGTLTVNGNYTQGSAGILNIAIASPTNYSRLAVGGHANLDGTLQLNLQGGFVPTNGNQFTILTTGKGISGQFRNVVSPQGQAFRVSYAQAGIVQLLAGVPKPPELPIAHISDGTPSSTTEMMADLSFFSFSSLAGRMAADTSGTEKLNAVGITFDAGEFRYQGHRGEVWGFPISGQRKLTDRVRLDYQIPLQYVDYPGAHFFQSGLILELPTKMILPSENHPWTWDCKPTVMVAASGSKEVIGGGALTNVFTYRWNDVIFTYANYIGVFEGDTLVSDDVQFRRGVDQQIMKNGLRVSIPIAKRSWLLEVYGVHTQSFQSASVPSYATIGVELGRHFIWNIEGRPMDLGFFSLGFYSDIGNHYSSGHFKIGSGWRF
jgi:autotransporter-associated beta strand protein